MTLVLWVNYFGGWKSWPGPEWLLSAPAFGPHFLLQLTYWVLIRQIIACLWYSELVNQEKSQPAQ